PRAVCCGRGIVGICVGEQAPEHWVFEWSRLIGLALEIFDDLLKRIISLRFRRKALGLAVGDQLDELHDQGSQQFHLVRAELRNDHAPPAMEFLHIELPRSPSSLGADRAILIASLAKLARRGPRLWSPPTSSSLRDEKRVPSLLLSTAGGGVTVLSDSSPPLPRPRALALQLTCPTCRGLPIGRTRAWQ